MSHFDRENTPRIRCAILTFSYCTSEGCVCEKSILGHGCRMRGSSTFCIWINVRYTCRNDSVSIRTHNVVLEEDFLANVRYLLIKLRPWSEHVYILLYDLTPSNKFNSRIKINEQTSGLCSKLRTKEESLKMHIQKIKGNVLMEFHDRRLTLKRLCKIYPIDMRK